MRLITIEVEDERMIVQEGKSSRSRHLFNAPGLQVYCKGSLDGQRYQQATALALAVCDEMHIPALSLRRADMAEQKPRSIDTDTRRMF